jgi:predicted O-methyltransferase YrrM
MLKTSNQIREFSIINHIPIVREKTLEYIINIIKKNHYKTLLEIGSAYGYSASCFSEFCDVLTVEKNLQNFTLARNFLKNCSRVNIIHADGLLYTPKQKYDLIFLDACKSKQEIFVKKYLPFLTKNGMLIIDNFYLKKISDIKYDALKKSQKKLLEHVFEFQQ